MLEIVAAEERVVFVRARGKVILADYRRAMPELERVLRGRGSRRLLLELDGFTGFTVPALFQEAWLLAKHRGRFQRIAVRCTNGTRKRIVRIGCRLTRGRVRCFDDPSDHEASQWITEGLVTWSRPLSAPDSSRGDLVDEASEESFPASDPPGYTPQRV